ncbi:MAG: xanthine dehydrogenase family protein molybdopterin-binding subunit [Pseudomonadota bacterium]
MDYPTGPQGMDYFERQLRGFGRFIEDEAVSGALAMVVVRSPVAHGFLSVDAEEARAKPGVVEVLTARDLSAAGVQPMALRAPLEGTDGPFRAPRRPVLAEDKVLYVGQPVAAVIAATLAEAQDAAEVVVVDVDDLPAAINPLEDNAPIHDDVPANEAFRWHKGNADEVERLIASAAHTTRLTVHHPRIAISPIEPRGALAEYADGRFTLTVPSQGVTSLRAALSKCLDVDPSMLRVITHDVGGSFAAKIWPYPEHVLALAAARQTGRPVRWIQTRSEAFTADAPGRARIDHGTLALDADGCILAFKIDAVADVGAYLSPAAPSIVTLGAIRPFQQVYDIPGQLYSVRAILTNAAPSDAYRGAGKPESTGTLERLIEQAARETGRDPWDLRKANLLSPDRWPLPTPMGETIDAGDFPDIAARIEEAADLPGLADRRAESTKNGLLRGASFGFYVHATGGSVAERSEVRALPDGTVLVRSGSQDSGQGHAEALARIAAEALEIDRTRIRVEQGDTDWGVDGASGGSNLASVTMNTVHRAAHAMIAKARRNAAELLEAAEADIAYGKGAFRIAGTDRAVALEAVAAAMEEDDDNCMAQLDFDGEHTTWPNGALAVEVEVDPETGGVRIDRVAGVTDLGRVIDPERAFGQIIGGLGQGVGEALMEGMRFDGDGQPLNASLMDYALPRADDLTMMRHEWAPTGSPNALLGAKGVGELVSIGAPGALANAVLDALAARGVQHVDMPLTPVAIWTALQRAG